MPSAAFVRGCPRSGTTLLADVMNESPDIGLLVEMPLGDLVRRMLPILWYEDNVRRFKGEIEQAGQRAAQSPKTETGEYFIPLDNLKRVTHARRYPTRDRFSAAVTAVIEASLEKPNLQIVGSKTPGKWDEYELDLVRAVYGKVRYVFVVRNPHETINSIVNRRNAGRAGLDSWQFQHVDEAIAAYHEATASMLSCLAQFPNDCYVVRYEELISAPAETLRALGEFLGVELHDRTALIERVPPSKSILDGAEEAAVRKAFGPAIDAWESKSLTGPGPVVGRQLDDCIRSVEIGREYRTDSAANDRSFLGSGWSALEPQGVWSDAQIADLYLRVPQAGSYALTIEFGGYVPTAGESLNVILALDGQQIFSGALADSRVVRLRCEPLALQPDLAHRLTFVLPPLRSPMDRGLGDDYRRLGVCLRGLLFEPLA